MTLEPAVNVQSETDGEKMTDTNGAAPGIEAGDEAMAGKYAAVVGARLRAVRRQKRLSLQAVEAQSGHEFRASVLGAYERGERSISVPRLQRLARLYAVPVDQLLPEGMAGGAALARQSEPTARNKIRIDLSALKGAESPEADALRHFLAQVQVQRQDFNGRVLTVRSEDLRVLGAIFGRNVNEMLESLDTAGLVFHPE